MTKESAKFMEWWEKSKPAPELFEDKIENTVMLCCQNAYLQGCIDTLKVSESNA